MINVYFISGLAADRRIFQHIRLPEGFKAIHLDWIPPLPSESLEDYSVRMADKIDRRYPFVAIGMSMGGMIAVELAKRYDTYLAVLISSVPRAVEMPYYFRWAARIRLQRWIPIAWVKNAALAKRLFTTESAEDKQVLKQIIRESDNDFVRWAMDAILRWRNREQLSSLIHIHGSRDILLPVRFTHPTHTIKGAGHLMVLNRAEQVNTILEEELGKLKQPESGTLS